MFNIMTDSLGVIYSNASPNYFIINYKVGVDGIMRSPASESLMVNQMMDFVVQHQHV